TICDHRANKPPTVTSTCQPRSASSPAAASPSSWGSRPEPASWASTTGRRRRPGRPGRSPLAGASRFARASARRATSEGSTSPSRLGGSRPARRAPSSDASPDTAHLPTHDVHPRTLELLGHVARHGRRDEHLTGARDEPGEPVPPARVELGEHVVEHEDRLAVLVLVPPRHTRGHELVARESQRKRERPRLPVARIPLGRQAAELEREVVAVRTDEAHPALDLLRTQPAHRLEQPRLEQGRRRRLVGLGRRRAVAGDPVERRDERDAHLALPRADLLIRARDVRGERRDELVAHREDLRAERRELRVPHVERAQVSVPARTLEGGRGTLEQSRALLEHPVVVLQGARHARAHHDGELVEEAPPSVRVTLDERKVLRGEKHRPHEPENVAHPLDGCPVDPGPVRTARGDLDLERGLALPALGTHPHERPLGPSAYERGVLRDTVARESRGVTDRLEEVRLAL